MKSRFKPYILLMPVFFVIIGILASGIILGILQSLGYFPSIGLKEITFKYYREILLDREFLSSFKFSIYISLVSSALAVVFGVILAYLVLQSKYKKIMEKYLYKLPVIVPHMAAALLVYNILAQSGMLPRLLYALGLLKAQESFPNLIFDSHGIGIIVTYLWKEIPFIAMVVYTVFSNISSKLWDAASNLGANKRQVFLSVLLPLALPSIFSSFIIIFAFSFGAFEVPYLLGPTSPRALSVKAYVEYSNPELLNRPRAMAINTILVLVSFILIWFYDRAFRLINRYNR